MATILVKQIQMFRGICSFQTSHVAIYGLGKVVVFMGVASRFGMRSGCPGEVPQAGCDVFPAGQPQQGDGGVAQDRHDLRTGIGTQLVVVFVERDVPDPLQPGAEASVDLQPAGHHFWRRLDHDGRAEQADHLHVTFLVTCGVRRNWRTCPRPGNSIQPVPLRPSRYAAPAGRRRCAQWGGRAPCSRTVCGRRPPDPAGWP